MAPTQHLYSNQGVTNMRFGKKVAFFRGRYANRVRQEKNGPKSWNLLPPMRRQNRSCRGVGRFPTSNSKRRKSTKVTIAGVMIPRALANVSHGRKYREGNAWILSSRRGIIIASFPCEEQLDRWWVMFQARRGRKPRPLNPLRRSLVSRHYASAHKRFRQGKKMPVSTNV